VPARSRAPLARFYVPRKATGSTVADGGILKAMGIKATHKLDGKAYQLPQK